MAHFNRLLALGARTSLSLSQRSRSLSLALSSSRQVSLPQQNQHQQLNVHFNFRPSSVSGLRSFSGDSSKPADDESSSQEEQQQGEEEAGAEDQTTAAEGEAAGSEEAAAETEEQPKEPTPEEKIAELEKLVQEKHEHMMMAYANEENALRIAKADVVKAREFAVQSFAKSLLDVADNLSRAKEAVPTDEIEKEGNELLKQLVEGVELTENGLLKAFKANGIVKFGEVGDTFDANLHEAMYMFEDPTQEPDTLGNLLQTGYTLNNRVIRPAKAGIVKASAAPKTDA